MLNIQYIEDHKEECEPFIRLIQLAGVARGIECTVTCLHGLAALGVAPLCDVILLDLDLGAGVRPTVDWIKEHSHTMPPIVVVTNHAGNEAECIRNGAEEYWHKPDVIAAPQIFIDCVNQSIIRHRSRLPL